MLYPNQNKKTIISYLLTLFFIIALAIWLKTLDLKSSWQHAGMINFSLGFVLIAAYACGNILKTTRLPLISGYIFAGILAGPYVSNLLTMEIVEKLRLVDDLALSFIALAAGGTLHLKFLKKRGKAILINLISQILIIFSLVFIFIFFFGQFFSPIKDFTSMQTAGIAMLIGVIAVARSPSSVIAIINECRAKGPFTETVLGITVVMDVLIIVFFTIAMTIAKLIMTVTNIKDNSAFIALSIEMTISIFIGFILGKGISYYIKRAGHDLPLFLLFTAFGVTKASFWLSEFMTEHFNIFLHLEPLLICMSAGFTVQNFSRTGADFINSLERSSLPIFVLFFSMAGASLNLNALSMCWALALCLTAVRAGGIFCSTWISGIINKDPAHYNKNSWMSYLTQAGVAIGLAKLAERQFPEIGTYLATIVLAIITINQIIGPIMFKIALMRVGEAEKP